MAGDRFRRFRHIERPRGPGEPAADAGGGAGRRFDALEERSGQAGAAPVADAHLDRFRAAPERPLEVAVPAEGELPFRRCARCGSDHHRSALQCATCGADLLTEEQRAFNARLAEARRADAAEEAVQAEAFRAAQADAAAEATRARRAMAETLAREVGDAERRRLDLEGMGGFGPPPGRDGWGGGWGAPGWSWGGGWGRRRGGFGLLGFLLRLLGVLLSGGRRWR